MALFRVTEVTTNVVASNYGWSAGWLIMPTDLGVASERKRIAAEAQTQTTITILLVCVLISLVMLVLLFADQSFSKATIELMGHLAP
jgi:hypothetical protein